MSTNKEYFLDACEKFHRARSILFYSCISTDYLKKALADADKSYELTADLIETREVMGYILKSLYSTLEVLQIALASLHILPKVSTFRIYPIQTSILNVADMERKVIAPFLARWQWLDREIIPPSIARWEISKEGDRKPIDRNLEKYVKAFFVDYHKFVEEFDSWSIGDSFIAIAQELEKATVGG